MPRRVFVNVVTRCESASPDDDDLFVGDAEVIYHDVEMELLGMIGVRPGRPITSSSLPHLVPGEETVR